VAGTPGDWAREKFKQITPDDHVWGWFQENATTVVRRKGKVLCVMAFEQALTKGAPPVLNLVRGAAITPMHHIFVNGAWRQARVAGARAARTEAVTPVPEFLEGELITRCQSPLGYITRWAMCQPGNFQLANGVWVTLLV